MAPGESMTQGEGARILVVDDDHLLRSVLVKELSTQGYSVRVLPDAQQVHAVVDQWKPDLILLDVVLPGVSGVALCANLRQRSKSRHIPILMLTSLDRPEDVVSGLDAGANDYICKPFNRTELRARIATQLRTWKFMNEMAEIEKHISLGRLTSGLCHEVNNPLTVVLGQLEMLAAGLHEQKPLKSVQLAFESAKRIQRLVKSMHEYADPLVRARSECDLNDVVEFAISIASLGWLGRPIEMERKLSAVPRVQGDQEKLAQVFINILTNASQVMPDGGKIVTETGTIQRGQVWVFASITDTGRGIPREAVARIFDPFFTTKENWHSPGLGLSVARRIVEEHHGVIEVESEEGAGATFRVMLPLASAVPAPAAPGI